MVQYALNVGSKQNKLVAEEVAAAVRLCACAFSCCACEGYAAFINKSHMKIVLHQFQPGALTGQTSWAVVRLLPPAMPD